MMQWALLGLFIMFLVVAYIIVQGTRAALAWRKAAAAGDLGVITDIVEDTLAGWRSTKRPKEVPSNVWRGVQSMQLVDVEADFVRVSAQAQSEYKMYEGHWIEVRNPLQEGMGIAAKAAEMLFYELPHYRPDRIQVDVYTSFRGELGISRNDCILSVETTREIARSADWDDGTPEAIVEHLGARYAQDGRGQPLAIEVSAPERLVDGEPSQAGSAS
jgi:hypothetical protein